MLEEMDASEWVEWLAVYQIEHEEAQSRDLASTAEAAKADIRTKR